ncbi:protease modulator HflK [Acidithiobacillus sp. CV18-2]|uniref:Protease modulator HflK n=1 Tax=Igneacidithiobacillus copahuensis TaxID=2724909 RepID=A0AAE2YR67_9PROT|nr:protease modulator HflK [Igneacidithiobacillus copahuensis]MBU2753539.1 protease modulator HflK [Acidithiobacillus sp. CV18-3]MBU2757388.1 protease modulator HflK [Acidithiobacillus sp. BN09-2]MBU2776033.1 protease modulator HflK [Acidithiobacillus sp. CV18-2]MBU2795924.1 protease modulator HflK [Acidithiobacillus sp. VAN18-2]MBU2800290.1 protease modulator HflK [Acidithiobacillus sp. VAN18-4]UTV79820.1 protease modulator HflK [Acidithiobacillus sp. YTS05]
MPWSDPGGNGKQDGNGSNKGPLGRRPGNSGASWNIDKITKELRKLGGKLSSSPGSGPRRKIPFVRWFPLIVVLVLVGVWLLSGFYQVGSGQEGIVLRFGRVVATVPPGSHYHWPSPIETVGTVEVGRSRRLVLGYGDSGEALSPGRILTSNNEVVDVRYAADYRIAHPRDFLFASSNPQQYLAFVLSAALRQVTSGMSSQQLLATAHAPLEQQLLQKAQNLLAGSDSGISLQSVQIIELTHPKALDAEYEKITKARKDAAEQAEQAKADTAKTLLAAKAEAAKMTDRASVQAEQLLGKAQGDVARFNAVYQAYQQDPQISTKQMYLQTMQDILAKAGKIVVADGNGAQVAVQVAAPTQSAPAAKASAPTSSGDKAS